MIYRRPFDAVGNTTTQSSGPLNGDNSWHQVSIITPDITGSFSIQVKSEPDSAFEIVGDIDISVDKTAFFPGYYSEVQVVPTGLASPYKVVFKGGLGGR